MGKSMPTFIHDSVTSNLQEQNIIQNHLNLWKKIHILEMQVKKVNSSTVCG
jgi:hypothetical protein